MMVKPLECWNLRVADKVENGRSEWLRDRTIKLICFNFDANRNFSAANAAASREKLTEFAGATRPWKSFSHGLQIEGKPPGS
jgi:hypothetical protein